MFHHPGKKNANADILANVLKPHVIFKYQQQLSDGKTV